MDYLAGYIPASVDIPINSTPNQVNDYSIFPDSGIKYAGYAKIRSGNGYKLLKQERFSDTYLAKNSIGVIGIVRGTPDIKHNLFITSMQVDTSITAVDVDSYVSLADANKTIFKQGLVRSETAQYNFDPPLKVENTYNSSITPSGLTFYYSSGLATMNTISINLQGFYEEKE